MTERRVTCPVAPENEVDETEFASMVFRGASNPQLVRHFGVKERRVRYLKEALGLTCVKPPTKPLPPVEELHQLWLECPTPTTESLARAHGCGVRTMQRHFREVGFRPTVAVPDEQVCLLLQSVFAGPWGCSPRHALSWAMSHEP